MFHHSQRGPRGLVPLVLRALALPSLLLGGLLQSSPAWAAKAEADGPVATLTGLAVTDEGMQVRIEWSKDRALPATAKLISYDGSESATDSVEVTPKPGEVSSVTLNKALQKPWETGWAQTLVLEDPEKGEPLLTQPYNVSLDCVDAESCTLAVAPGAASNKDMVHLSSELDEAITKLEAEAGSAAEFDVVEQVSKHFPHLRGEVYSYAHQLSKVRPFPGSGPCECTWQAVYTQNPGGVGYGISVSNTGGIVGGWNGPGAKHSLTAIAGTGISYGVGGSSQVSLKLNCKQWKYVVLYYIRVYVFPFGWFSFPVYGPAYVPCVSTCAARFDHMGRISGDTFVSYTSPNSSATAVEAANYIVDGSTLLNTSASQGGTFYQGTTTSVWSNLGSTGRVNSSGTVRASRALPYWASASVSNGHAIAIHGQSFCPYGPYWQAAVWTYGTSQGIPQTSSLRQGLISFFWQWGIPTNP